MMLYSGFLRLLSWNYARHTRKGSFFMAEDHAYICHVLDTEATDYTPTALRAEMPFLATEKEHAARLVARIEQIEADTRAPFWQHLGDTFGFPEDGTGKGEFNKLRAKWLLLEAKRAEQRGE